MLNPAATNILTQNTSPYSLVIAVSRRAREISEVSEDNHQILVDKPVKLAVDEFMDNKFRIIEERTDES